MRSKTTTAALPASPSGPPSSDRRALPRGTLTFWGIVLAALIVNLSVRVIQARGHATHAGRQISMHDANAALEERLGPLRGAQRQAAALRLSQDESPALRYASIDALAEQPSPAVLDAVEQAFTDSDSEVRKRALEKTIELDKSGARSLRLTLAALRDEDNWVREDAAGQINLRIGRPGSPFDKRAVPALMAALGDEDENVSSTAATALNKLTGHHWKISIVAPIAQREATVAKWRAWWQSAQKDWPVSQELAGAAPRPPTRSDAAPDFAIDDVDGRRVSKTDLAGKITLLNFWGTWCGPCKAEMPDLIKIHAAYRERNVAVIGMACDEKSASGLKDFAREHQIAYRQVMADSEIRNAFGDIEEVPVSFLIDGQGRIRRRWDGERDFATFQAAIESLLHEKTAP